MSSNANILSEYLVKLGFTADTASFARFAHSLRDAESLVDNSFYSMGKKVLGFQVAATGAFAAIGAGVLGIAEHVADADQEFRLLALRMYTTTPVARELKIALDALGQPLSNVMWDKELAGRFHQLVEDQRTLTQELGPDFESQMVRIRDVRFEFTRLGVELQYLAMEVVKDLAEAFGTTIGGLLDRMRAFNSWFIANMPKIARWITNELKPVLVDVWQVLLAAGEAARSFAVAFTQIVGILDNDKALEGTTFSFEKLSLAIQKSLGLLRDMLIALSRAEQAIPHMIEGVKHANIVFSLAPGDPRNGPEWKAMTSEFQQGSNLLDLATGYTGTNAKDFANDPNVGRNADFTKQAIVNAARSLGVNPALALAVAQNESGFRQFDSNGNPLVSGDPNSHATGIFQLQPGTARSLGVDPASASGNIYGGVKYLQQLLKQYSGNEELALEHYYGSKSNADNQAYAQKVIHIESGVQIGTVTITVPASGMSKDSIIDAVKKGIDDATKNKTQRNLSEFASPGYSY